MRKHTLYFLINLAFIVSICSSCKKDDEVTPPTQEQKLVAGEWKGQAVIASGLDVSNLPTVRNIFPDIKTLTLDFKEDKTYVATYSDDEDGNQTSTGTWELRENDTKLWLDFAGETTINMLTEANLNLGTTVTNAGVTANVEVRFTK